MIQVSRKDPRDFTLQEHLMHLQQSKCFHCGCIMRLGAANDRDAATLDHIEPRSRGGKQAFNQILACRECNNKRGDARMDEIKARRARKISRIAYSICGGCNP